MTGPRSFILGSISLEGVNKARLATQVGIALYIFMTVAYVGFGQANADEAWYIYASKLVLQGARPYRDFVYPQMPLLPYIYAVLQVFQPSIFWGRLTSAILSVGTLGMSLVIARRYAGDRGAAIAALLLAAFSYGVYYDSIVKTYALVTFCFTATLFVLSSDMEDTNKYGLAVLFALGAALIRLTALFFAAPILLYALAAARPRGKALALFETGAAGVVAGIFFLPDWPVAQWNLLGSHLAHWQDSPLVARAIDILTTRLPSIAQTFGPLLVLMAAALFFVFSWQGKSAGRSQTPLLVTSVSLVLFAASHLVNGLWQVEYLVPAAVALLPILAIALSQLYGQTSIATRSFLLGALAAVLILLPLGESTQHTDLSGGRLPLGEVDAVAAFVARNSQPGDPVLALEALNVVVDANRLPFPGMTLAQFSLQDVDTPTAQQLHVVNYALVAQAVNQKQAPVLVLTDYDLQTLAGDNPSDPGAVQRALDQNYRQALVVPQFGQFEHTLYVYTSK